MIAHPLLRFYLQFVEPNIERLRMDNGEFVKRVRYQMDQFFRRKIFPVLCREWVWAQVALGRLPFIPESVGGFWKKNDSLDLLAINWQQKWMMLGQCLWSKPAKIEKIVCDMIGLSKSIVNGDDWKTQVVIFFGPDMASTLSNHPNISIKIVLVDSLDEDLYKGRVALKEKRFRALTD